MNELDKDDGVALALLNRLNDVRLPRLLAIKEQVDGGDVLSESEFAYLDRVLGEAVANRSQWEKHPELTKVISSVSALYNEITTKALANEGGGKSS